MREPGPTSKAEKRWEGKMTTRRLIPILTLSGLLLTGGMAQAAQAIPPVDPITGQPITSPTVTVTLNPDGWLPTPGSTVVITVNGLPVVGAITLVCPDGSFA